MIWSMIFSTVVAFVSAIIMGFTTGNWVAEMETELPYFTWFINVTKSVYGGGVWCAIIMMGLNVCDPFQSAMQVSLTPDRSISSSSTPTPPDQDLHGAWPKTMAFLSPNITRIFRDDSARLSELWSPSS